MSSKKARLWIPLIAAAVLIPLFYFKRSVRDGSPRPNIILIVIDALRADRTGTYGHYRNTSPTIDSVSSEGVVFDRALSQAPWTLPSMATLFCSKYPGVHKITDFDVADGIFNSAAEEITVLDGSFVTLAEVLRDNGYQSAAVVANILLRARYGFAQGFDHYEDLRPEGDLSSAADVRGNEVNGKALSWLDRRDKERPFFLYLHYMDVHGPYYSRPAFHEPFFEQARRMPNNRTLTFDEKLALGYLVTSPLVQETLLKDRKLARTLEFWPAFYDSGIREMDEHMKALKRDLEKRGLWEETLIIITSDHGEELLEHGFWDHGSSLYQAALHVPLILRWPRGLPEGRRVGGTVRLLDLMPTLLDLLEIPETAGLQGRSLAPEMTGTAPGKQVPALIEAVKQKPFIKSLYYGDWKLISGAEGKGNELYRIADDPMERSNLYASHPDKLSELLDLMKRQLIRNNELASGKEVDKVPITPDDRERLESLGYVE